jgi:transposase
MRVTYNIKDNLKEEIKLLLKQEQNLVVKERLIAVSLFANGMLKRDIANTIGKGTDTIGRWITAYFKGGIDALQDNRGGDHKSFLSSKDKEELKYIIINTYPVVFKGWDGKIIVDLIQSKYRVTYTRAGVYALLKSLGITHKIATKIDPKKSEAKIATWKEDIKKKLLNLPKDIILLSQDESRFSSETNRVTSWSQSGSSIVYSGYRYGTSLNCFGSINLSNGNLISSFHDRGNAEATIEHFKKVRSSYDKNIIYFLCLVLYSYSINRN